MEISDILNSLRPPEPWSEGDNIPWHDPAFSERMLKEHLSQAHNAASRKAEIIDQHVTWIHDEVLGGRQAKILDLGCGPGLYAHRLTALGHHCVGIDYSPASIRYAREQADAQDLDCTFVEADLRHAEFGRGFDLVMLIFGELNVFPRAAAADMLSKAAQALEPGGTLLLEVHTLAKVEANGQEASRWSASASGLFSAEPHLLLKESFWDPTHLTATQRYFVVDTVSHQVQRYASSQQGYRDEGYQALLTETGFRDISFLPRFGDAAANDDFFVILSTRS
jgi:SAM-dependent methyltransferase